VDLVDFVNVLIYLLGVFDNAVNGSRKNDENAYKPRRTNPDLSEESEDDFDMIDLEEPALPVCLLSFVSIHLLTRS
jgi:hypothetical protein